LSISRSDSDLVGHGTRRKPIIGGNWKMNTLIDSAQKLAVDLRRLIGEEAGADVVVFPPFPNLQGVHAAITGSSIRLGGQDVFWEDSGAFTGEVSAPMLQAVGCEWVLTGHSERRHVLGETDEVVNKKLRAVLRHGLHAILAVGETKEERRGGRTESVLSEQLKGSLAEVSAEDMGRVVIAYEPVWAIGTGDTASPEQAREAHAFCRTVLASLYDEEIASATRIQYGGSVTAANSAELLSLPDIDGALVGGASLKAEEFAEIVRSAARAARP
jgi:triosephosphate isomerase